MIRSNGYEGEQNLTLKELKAVDENSEYTWTILSK